jgi:hypothetical protein
MRTSIAIFLLAGGGCWGAACSSPVGIDGGNADAGSDASRQDGCANACTDGQACFEGQCCAPPPGNGLCDVYPECGCSASQNCVRVNGGAEACVANGNVSELGVCTDSTNCAHGLACSDLVCDPTCATQSNCLANFLCVQEERPEDGGAVELGYGACAPHCNPVQPFTADSAHVACGSGERCDPYFDAQGYTKCEGSSGTLGQGESCTSDTACAAGFDCTAPTGQSNTCRHFCRYDYAPSDCAAGLTCAAFTTAQYDGTVQIGVCQ